MAGLATKLKETKMIIEKKEHQSANESLMMPITTHTTTLKNGRTENDGTSQD